MLHSGCGVISQRHGPFEHLNGGGFKFWREVVRWFSYGMRGGEWFWAEGSDAIEQVPQGRRGR